MIETFKIDTFSEGDVLQVHTDETTSIEIILYKAYEGQHKTPQLKRAPFAWVFKAPKEPYIVPGSYKITQSKVGEFQMNLNPVVPFPGQGDHAFYEAVFS